LRKCKFYRYGFKFQKLDAVGKSAPRRCKRTGLFGAKSVERLPRLPVLRLSKVNDGKTYKCGDIACHKKYTVTVGTIFQGSHIPLKVWFFTMYLLAISKKGISSLELARDVNITQKSAWLMLHRIRGTMGDNQEVKLSG
jgi:hypothetical protein